MQIQEFTDEIIRSATSPLIDSPTSTRESFGFLRVSFNSQMVLIIVLGTVLWVCLLSCGIAFMKYEIEC